MMRIAFIGFGEAGQAFAAGLAGRGHDLAAYDIATDSVATRAAKADDYARHGVTGYATPAQAIPGAHLILSLVTADQALAAATAAAPHLGPDSLFCDMNSVAPATKRAAAAVVEAPYVDVAVMAPVNPARLRVPLLVAGPEAAVAALAAAGFDPRGVTGAIGTAAAIKMIRSVMVKGIEALTAECVVAAVAAGVDVEVLASLDATPPPPAWSIRADYNLDRMLVHGRRRAAEMVESATTVRGLGLPDTMARATAGWQDRIGALGLAPPSGYAAKAHAILAGLAA